MQSDSNWTIETSCPSAIDRCQASAKIKKSTERKPTIETQAKCRTRCSHRQHCNFANGIPIPIGQEHGARAWIDRHTPFVVAKPRGPTGINNCTREAKRKRKMKDHKSGNLRYWHRGLEHLEGQARPTAGRWRTIRWWRPLLAKHTRMGTIQGPQRPTGNRNWAGMR